MKTFLTLFLSAILCLTAFSQTTLSKVKHAERAVQPQADLQLEKFAPGTGMLLLDLQRLTHRNNEVEKRELVKEYGLQELEGALIVGAFLHTSPDFNPAEVVSFAKHIKRHTNEIATVRVDVHDLHRLSQIETVTYIEIAEPVKQKLDIARNEVRAHLVHLGQNLPQPYKGSGVLVGVMDGGFDFTHPTYYTEDGQLYRVTALWDQSNSFGTSPQAYNYGSEVIGGQGVLGWMNDNLFENGVWVTQGSHGTHVSSIAAGSGLGTNGSMAGFAPDSEIAIVSFLGTNQGFADGASWLASYAQLRGLPCVINMSLGTHIGPHDGTSFTDQIFDAISGPGTILVGACGNEGDVPLHLYKTFTPSDTAVYSFAVFQTQLGTDGTAEFDLWGTPGVDFKAAINLYEVTQSSFVSWTPYIAASDNASQQYSLPDLDGEAVAVTIGSEAANPNNNKPHIQIAVDAREQTSQSVYVMLEIIATGGSVHTWVTDPTSLSSLSRSAPFQNGDVNNTAGELGGTGKSVITVGAYNTKNSWQSLQQGVQQTPFPGTLGDAASFTSRGPTADNRTKPDISAPGNAIVAAFNSDDPEEPATSPRVVSFVTDGNRNWYYGAFQGTSMSSPAVAGSIALMLQVDPSLEYSTAVDILRNTAFKDSFTGNIGSAGHNVWGWGKLDTYDAVSALIDLTSIHDKNDISRTIDIQPNPSTGAFYLGGSLSEPTIMTISAMDGRQVYTEALLDHGGYTTVHIDVPDLRAGMYIIRLENKAEFGVKKLIIQR